MPLFWNIYIASSWLPLFQILLTYIPDLVIIFLIQNLQLMI